MRAQIWISLVLAVSCREFIKRVIVIKDSNSCQAKPLGLLDRTRDRKIYIYEDNILQLLALKCPFVALWHARISHYLKYI